MRCILAWLVLGISACGGESGPLPPDGGSHSGRDAGGRDGGSFFPDAAHLDAGKMDAPSLFDAPL